MRLAWSVVAAVFFAGALVQPSLAAELDRKMSVQGAVATSSGSPANGTFAMEFRLFAAQTGGTAVWSQTIPGVVVASGLFDVELGPVPKGILESAAMLWLESVVSGSALPRQPLRSVAYSLVAQQANDLACSGCVGTADLADGAISPAKLGSGTYGINITGNAATATTSGTAVSATSFSGALGGDVTGTQSATKVVKLNGVNVSNGAPGDGQVLKYSAANARWEAGADTAGAGSVTSVGTGAGLTGGPITAAGTIDLRLSTTGGLSKGLGASSNELGIAPSGITPGMVAGGSYGISVTGSAGSAATASAFSGSLSGDVAGGQSATQVQKIRGVTVATTAPASGQVLKYNGTQWAPAADTSGSGTVTNVATGQGLTGGPISTSGTIDLRLNAGGGLSKGLGAGSNEVGIAAGGVTPAMVGAGTYGISISGNAATATSATSAGGFTGALAGDVTGGQGATVVGRLRGRTVATTAPANGQVLKYNSTTAQWEPGADNAGAGGTVTAVNTGAGLMGGPITGSGTVDLRLATGGGLSKTLGAGSDLGVAAGGITPSMVGGGTYGISISGNAATASSATSAGSATTAGSFTGSLSGDVAGGQSSTSVQKIRGVTVAAATPSSGQVLKYNSGTAQWEPGADAVGSGVTGVTASSPLASSGGTNPNITLAATVPIALGGTGITGGPSGAGQFLRSSGAGTWGVATLQGSDVPGGSGSYINNTTSAQSANFNVTGTGTMGNLTVGATGTASGDFRAPIFYDLNNTGYYLDPTGTSQVSTIYANNWFRAQGTTGVFFSDYSGGLHMTDTTWVRVYNGKAFLVENEIRSTNNMRAPIFYDLNDGGYYTDPNGTSRENVLHPNVISCMNGYCPANSVARLTPNLHLNSLAGYSVILNWDNGTTGAAQTLRVGNGAGGDVFYVRADGLTYAPQFRDLNDGGYYLDPNGVSQLHYVLANNWFRGQGDTGLYFESYGGGWHMTDTTWIRAYNSKNVYSPATIQAGGDMRAPIFYDLNDTGYYADPNGTTVLNNLQVNGRFNTGGGCPAPFTSFGVTLSNSGYANKLCMWRWSYGNYQNNMVQCLAFGGHTCSYSEIYAIAQAYGTSPAGIGQYNGDFIGNRPSDDAVYYINNQNDLGNFEGHRNKNDTYYSSCCFQTSFGN